MNNQQSDIQTCDLPSIAGANIVLGVCGGIAAYKAAYLVRELCALGAQVRVVMTASATAFIGSTTFQALSGEEVRCDLFDAQAEQAMGHIELARWADYLLIAPASADFIAKMAHGLASDLLSTVYLATTAPVIVCPAMNRNMWEHPATQANCALLTKRSVLMVGPGEGSQACGEYGLGRMVDTADIIAALRLYTIQQVLMGQEVMITAGPTQEAIDPVRYISNHSSGKMGYALAKAAHIAGAKVTLVSGPTALVPPIGVHFIAIKTAQEMLTAVQQHFKAGMIFIGAAAVADYAVEHPADVKLKRQSQDVMTLTFKKNPDILATVVANQQAALVVGFAAETHDVIAHAEDKRLSKGVDIMIANQVGESMGFGCEEHQVTLLMPHQHLALKTAHKTILAGQIIAIISHFILRKQHEPSHTN